MPESVKEYVQQKILAKGHLDEISGVFVVEHLSPWLTTQQAWEELAEKAVYDKGIR